MRFKKGSRIGSGMGLFGSSDDGDDGDDDSGGFLSSVKDGMKQGKRAAELQSNLGSEAMQEYAEGDYDSPEAYVVAETSYDSWEEFVEGEDDSGDGSVDDDGATDEPAPDGEDVSGEVTEKDRKVVEDHLDPDEEPKYVLKGASITIEGGNSEDRKGSLTGMARTAVTEKRVLTVVPQKLMGEDTKSVPYEEMGGVDFNKGLMNKYLKIQSHGRTYKIHTTDADRTREALDYIRQRKQEIEAENRSSGGSEPDPTEQLKNLKELHDQGVVSDEEFEEKKETLLDQI